MQPMPWSPIPSDDEISASCYSPTSSNENESPKSKKLKTQEKEVSNIIIHFNSIQYYRCLFMR